MRYFEQPDTATVSSHFIVLLFALPVANIPKFYLLLRIAQSIANILKI
jgi:hypothetical protein